MAKRRWGDRWDGTLVRDIDAMHYITPLIYPNRTDNEAFISEKIDLTNINAYLEKKNAGNPEYRYNLFQVIVATLLKTFTLRPKMNRFIANKSLFQRNELSAAFVVKKLFTDEAEEALAFIHSKDSYTIDDVHNEIYRQVSYVRSENAVDDSTAAMEFFTKKLPRFLSRFLIKILTILERHGKLPKSLVATDPYYASIVLSNLGSIKLHSGYHHLTNWGTNSAFVIVGERKIRPFFDDEGNVTMKDSVDLGMTVDERISDGYYFSKSVRLLKYILEHPECLDEPFSKEVDY